MLEEYTIDVTNCNLIELIKLVYKLSKPIGNGYNHFDTEPLTDQEAKELIDKKDKFPVNLDYVKGRSCKFKVYCNFGKYPWSKSTLSIRNEWRDHTKKDFEQLLKIIQISQ
jgi:hypothetical protein